MPSEPREDISKKFGKNLFRIKYSNPVIIMAIEK
jgi:hypothetical protein